MFYFMYALGDIPQELGQFVQLESVSLTIALVSLVLFIHCLAVVVNPSRSASGKRHR